MLPILSAYRYGKKEAEARSAATLPRQGNNRSKWSSFLRFGYYYLDYLFGQIYVFCKYLLRSYIVLYDRYYFDFIVDGQRSNISIGDKVPRLLYRFIYKPQLNLFLYAHPDLILRRKQELTSETILDLTHKYQDLFKSLSDKESKGKPVYLAIENNIKEETLQTIFSNYKKLDSMTQWIERLIQRKNPHFRFDATVDFSPFTGFDVAQRMETITWSALIVLWSLAFRYFSGKRRSVF